MVRTALAVVFALLAAAVPAWAQPTPGGCNVTWQANSDEAVGINTNHYILLRNVQVTCNDMQLFADRAEVFSDSDRVRAWGNVLFVTSDNRISADRMEFNTRTKTGTFFVASGIANIANRGIERSLFGGQEPDAYFWGETIEKLGPKTYRLTRGGFTTCVQPTPRWELVSGSATITLEQHAVLTNTLLMVKGVPMFYLPVMYYPINKEDRATGFLIPIYGTSTVRGQSISVPFFWAINRSQDATMEYDFFSKTGHAYGGEYRYVQAPGSQGSIRTQYISEHDATYVTSTGAENVVPGQSSYSITGTMAQRLPHGLRATGNANYFSSLIAQQRYQQNVYAATNRTRTFNVGVSGTFSGFTVTGTVDHSEIFASSTLSNVYGSLPRIAVNRAETPIGKLPLYFGAQGEYVTLQRIDRNGAKEVDRGLTRIDFLPTLRFPFTRWEFLTFNSSLSWRATYWSESLDGATQVPDPIGRRYFDMNTRITGPTFSRIFSSPARKIKHVIEPTLVLQHITPIDNFTDIVKLDGTDYVVGRVTRLTYGLNNRLYVKHQTAREVLDVGVTQSYYTDANAAQYDRQYQSSFTTNLPPTHRSPVSVQVHATPTEKIDTTFRTEYDTQAHAIRTIAANGSWRTGWVQTIAGWSQRRFIPNLSGFNNLALASNYVNAATTVKKPGNAWGGSYTFNYDLKNQAFLQQRYVLSYNSQCCGVGVEYQSFSYGTALASVTGIPRDRRFNISFTLAGIGSFSNLFGAVGGQTR
jgi:LPS-assembly protein